MLLNKYIEQKDYGNPNDILEQKEAFLVNYTNVLTKVVLRTINPSDILSLYGEGQYRYNHSTPRIPGFEAVGIVIGSKKPEYKVGDRVLIMTSGTWQTFIDIEPQQLLKLPKKIPDNIAVQCYINGLTAWVILTEVINISKDDVVIINAGNSSIAKIFIQLSKCLNYKIIVVTSSKTSKRLYDYGADFVINSKLSLQEQIIKNNIPLPNIALDAVGGLNGVRLLETISNNGRFIVYGCLSMTNYPKKVSNIFYDKKIIPERFFLKEWEKRVGAIFRNAKLNQFIDYIICYKLDLPVYKNINLDNFKLAFYEIENRRQNNKYGKILLSSY
ncbi:alcohol dehydrogenase catalytic domain-containing protein [Francisella salimarina]|uniref:Alcohol dehydrogenase catalytic domain-containing protein n=1 Tax=Francisella salimarina TaxID=2599927 RepID=A0AAJ4NMA8_9GAMM|nr:alcohol dehydrogenase catalytic domain-containing protein [Francisella salimarina]QWU98628.1 alcohol dehydrogenase catalytic domain-containing protein [Francisella salimarina]